MTTDPTTVPAAPLYTVTLTSAGGALLNGEEVPVPPNTDLHEVRIAALREVQIKAALLDRPVRVTAKEVDGTAWYLIVPVDGPPVTLAHPHPRPAAVLPTPAPAPPPAVVRPTLPTPAPPPAAPVRQFATGPVQPAAAPPPFTPPAGPPHEVPVVRHAVTPQPPAPTPNSAAAPDSEWAAIPPVYESLLVRIRAQDEEGDLEGALATAEMLDSALTSLYGEHHPHALNAIGLRAWLTLRRGDWPEAADLLLLAVERRRAVAAPAEDTDRLARDAHLAWRRLTSEDPEYALELADRLLAALDGDERRRRHVIDWVGSGAARST
ncbi:hypothetical protein AB0C76_32890 [Kitasatospora sp. NPDC048722]|uniref:hypothetical protein n=1 Tax=Kitasatospora sp. NPDC048722 TaxID=3155639 RepID=UPI0033EB9FE2